MRRGAGWRYAGGMTVQELIDRARSAIGLPTVYALGHGGFDPQDAQPGGLSTVQSLYGEVPANKRALFEQIALDAGYPRSRWQDAVRACDCSGFTNWVIGVVRGGQTLAWINTDAMYRYLQPRVLDHFHPPQPMPQVGGLVVYPSGRRGEAYGHVGVVTEVTGGRVSRVIHCSPTNFRFGGHHDAIEETGPEVFERHAPLRYLMPKVIDGSMQPSEDA
jgi:hypothetical protein